MDLACVIITLHIAFGSSDTAGLDAVTLIAEACRSFTCGACRIADQPRGQLQHREHMAMISVWMTSP